MKLAKVLLVAIFILQFNTIVCRLMKMIYERDMSEHCRRRVIPSVFLGRKVVEANARILQFSRLELPYSCFITVRSESGNNMVMMIQVMSKEVTSACDANEQLLIYEMGETFGGYWGPLPDSVLKRQPLPPQIYTLKTTRAPTVITYRPESEEEEDEEPLTTTRRPPTSSTSSPQPTGDYIEVVVPLVNFSAHFERTGGGTAPDDVNILDLEDDLTPAPDVEYNSEILPLVQFQMVGGGPQRDPAARYNLELGLPGYTPGLRLTLPPLNPTTKKITKQRYQPTRRVDFKKHRTLFQSVKQNRRFMPSATEYSFPTKKSTVTQDSWNIIEDLLQRLSGNKGNSTTTTLSTKEVTLLEKIGYMDHSKSAYLSPNLSIYETIARDDGNYFMTTKDKALDSKRNTASLSSKKQSTASATTRDYEIKLAKALQEVTADLNGFSYDKTTNNIKLTTGNNMKEYTTKGRSTANDSPVSSEGTLMLKFEDTSESSEKNINEDDMIRKNTETVTSDVTSSEALHIMSSSQNSNSIPSINTMPTGPLVGHESWENLVQAAPEMAELLNKTVDNQNIGSTGDGMGGVTTIVRKNVVQKRKKRDIHSIAIENARPHMLTTKKVITTTTKKAFNVGDMQEFAQLAEMQDDEMHGRVALRYLRQYVGPPLFNLCGVNDLTKPNVFLFNSSRIVLSLTNFTIERMVIILTAARALRSGESKCPRTRLECQVAGARVCMDTMVACDGVPNCGSYDIYDEDRLLCGHTAIMQRNVYLAAFTFLAVLLTIMYAVHYWLKRCVPKVADAFFVYSDGVENILYLDTIMRSPHDMEDAKMGFHSHMFGDDMYDEELYHHNMSLCQRFLRMFCACCFRTAKKRPLDKGTSNININGPGLPKRMYSFTELEIRKMLTSPTKDTSVQTGDSLLMNVLPPQARRVKLAVTHSPPPLRATATSFDFTPHMENAKKDSLLTLEEPLPEQYKDELSLLKFFKESRSDVIAAKRSSLQRNSFLFADASVGSSEQEIEITTYERLLSEPGPSRLVRNTERQRTNVDKDKWPSDKVKLSIEKEKTSPQGSTNKHLRFDETPVTIPLADDNDDGHYEGRRVLMTADKHRRHSRHLEPIVEADEPGGTKDHRHFWRTKGKRNKKGQVSLR